MNGAAAISSQALDRVQRWAMLCAAAGVVLCLVALVVPGWRTQFLQSYLWARGVWSSGSSSCRPRACCRGWSCCSFH